MSDTPGRTPHIDPVRTVQAIILLLWDTTLIYLVAAILNFGGDPILRWWIVFLVVAASALATARLEPVNADVVHIRPLTAIVATLVIGWSVAWHIRGVNGTIALGTLVDPDDPAFMVGYVALIAGIVAWLRGAQLLDIAHPDAVQRFRRGFMAVMVTLGVATLAGFGQGLSPRVNSTAVDIPTWIVVWLMLGLLSLSVTRITTVEGDSGRSARWLWLRSSALSTLAILLGGLVVLSLVAAPAGAVLREAARWVLYAFGLAFAPIGWLIYMLLRWVRETFLAADPNVVLPPPVPTALPDQIDPLTTLPVPQGLLAFTILLLLLLPVVILVLLIVFARRRRSAVVAAADEQRESIFSWGALGNDIAHLLGLLRRGNGEGGLRNVLRSLAGADPATRIRRRYVQLLLRGEDADKHRRADETPREFAASLGSVMHNRTAVDALTDAYERARYAPASVDQATADRADRAWQALDDGGR
jgi:hypothetical protein